MDSQLLDSKRFFELQASDTLLADSLLADGLADGLSHGNGHAQQHVCVVCGDESDGLHFGQYTCRACAAFFRRTVSLKLQYTCKHDGRCAIERNARNMCRSCRFEKCLAVGMLTSAVQHSRDGLGKRKETKKLSQSSDTPPDIKVPKPQGQGAAAALTHLYATQIAPSYAGVAAVTPCHSPLPNGIYFTTLTANGGSGGGTSGPSYVVSDFANLQLSHPNGANSNGTSGGSAFTQLQGSSAAGQQQKEMQYLARMLDGYNHFISLRKASYTLVEGMPSFKESSDPPSQSNFGTSKKICKIEASLIMDTVEKFFTPFAELSPTDKNTLFESFYCLFSNTERAFRTYRLFGVGDDRLLMPDGGYLRLSELDKFYANNSLVKGDPLQVAKIFESAMHYLVNIVVSHMRHIRISEIELMVLFAMFIWKDNVQLSPDTMAVVLETRDNIIMDLHTYYRNQGLHEAQITVKTANLLLLLPKLENSVKLLKENFHIADLFNLMQLDSCCSKINSCS